MTFARMPKPRFAPSALALILLAAPLLAQTPLTIVTSSFPGATVGTPYSVGFTVSGGTAPYVWSGNGNIPPGLTIVSSGSIAGTPTVQGVYSFNLIVTDSRQVVATRSVSLTVGAASLSITTASPLPEATVGQSYAISFAATGGVAPYRWAAGAEFPVGLMLDAQTGVVSGAPTSAGTFAFAVRVTDANQTAATSTFSLTVNAAPLTLTTIAPLFAGTIGVPYSQPFSASGGAPPYSWTILSGDTGALALNPSTGTLSGTPQSAGTLAFTIQVRDSAGRTASRAFSILVSPPVLTVAVASALPGGAVGVPYSQRLPVTATGGVPPYQWNIASSLPPGLDFDPGSLTLSGTPAAAGSFNIAVQVTDASRQSAAKALTLVIAPPSLTITTDRQLPDGSLNTAYAITMSAVGGLPPYTWTAAGLPAGLTLDPATGVIAGTAAAGGSFAVAVTVTDSGLTHISDRFSLKIGLPAVPAISISGLPAEAAPAEQYSIQVTLASPFPAPITGQAILTFSAESGPVDRTVQFAGGGTIANFSIPAGATTAVASAPLAIQTGTVCGAIGVSLRLQAGGIDITPPVAPALNGQIARAAPVISDVRVSRADGKVTLTVAGYSTAREVVQAVFTFSAAAGQTLQSSAGSVSVPVESVFSTWFQDSANAAYGSQFVLTQPFTVQGDPAAVVPQAVTLSNRTGSTTFRIP